MEILKIKLVSLACLMLVLIQSNFAQTTELKELQDAIKKELMMHMEIEMPATPQDLEYNEQRRELDNAKSLNNTDNLMNALNKWKKYRVEPSALNTKIDNQIKLIDYLLSSPLLSDYKKELLKFLKQELMAAKDDTVEEKKKLIKRAMEEISDANAEVINNASKPTPSTSPEASTPSTSPAPIDKDKIKAIIWEILSTTDPSKFVNAMKIFEALIQDKEVLKKLSWILKQFEDCSEDDYDYFDGIFNGLFPLFW